MKLNDKRYEHIYQDADCKDCVKVIRIERNGKKNIHQQRLENNKWINGGVKTELPPYRHSSWRESEKSILLVEGEKKVEKLESEGFSATTTIKGANSWRAHYAAYFKDRDVILIPDNNAPGEKYIQNAARDLIKVCKSLRVLRLPNLEPGEDVYDWFEKGGTKEELDVLLQNALDFKSSAIEKNLPSIENEEVRETSLATSIVYLMADANYFHTPDGVAYACIRNAGHNETWPIRSTKFKSFVIGRVYKTLKRSAGTQSLNEALAILESQALYDGPQQDVFLRVARYKDTIHYDLGSQDWSSIVITANGWDESKTSEVNFTRAGGMARQPSPIHGGNLNLLREFMSIKDENTWILICAWLIGALNPYGPFAILILSGEQGSAKSSFARFLRALIDPSSAPLRTLSTDERNLFIFAQNNYVLALDNISSLSHWQSDAFCKISTGGGFANRRLYTDCDEIILNVVRPIILNGIGEISTRPDLLDRAIVLNLPSIPESLRRPEQSLKNEFELIRPKILGALFDAVAGALRTYTEMKLPSLPRMADFTLWVESGLTSIGFSQGTFLKAFNQNREESSLLALEGSAVAQALEFFIKINPVWTGTVTRPMEHLRNHSLTETMSQAWPKSSISFANELWRIAPNLRKIGIAIQKMPRKGTERTIRIGLIETLNKLSQTSQSSLDDSSDGGDK